MLWNGLSLSKGLSQDCKLLAVSGPLKPTGFWELHRTVLTFSWLVRLEFSALPLSSAQGAHGAK